MDMMAKIPFDPNAPMMEYKSITYEGTHFIEAKMLDDFIKMHCEMFKMDYNKAFTDFRKFREEQKIKTPSQDQAP